mmetsp:Transcript_9177/g.16101  ORF Transcript_9177/g.16101 Transcript_9177/m.16101 type:complete len:492 (+) Transcript_9177:124-1599(+)
MSAILRPVLRGTLETQPSGKTVWSGVWCMRKEDLDKDSVTATFSYERTGDIIEKGTTIEQPSPRKSSLPKDGLYSGHFDVRTATGSSRVSEKNVIVQFRDGGKVYGSGGNKLGQFKLEGSIDTSTGLMTVIREYVTKKQKRNARSQARVQRELSLGPVGVTTPSKSKNEELDEELGEDFKEMLKKMALILDKLMEADQDKWFCTPVDAAALGLSDYHDIIREPMDLGTIKEKYNQGGYQSPRQMRDDMVLTFSNAVHYNARGNPVYKRAVALQERLASEFAAISDPESKSEISTPAPPSLQRIGKRHSIPKIIFEPESKRPRSTSVPLGSPRANATGTTPRKRSKRSESTTSPRKPSSAQTSSSEIVALQSQLERLQENLKELTSSMLGSHANLMPSMTAGEFPGTYNATEEEKAIPFDVLRKLGRDIHHLSEQSMSKVINIIEDNGFKLPVNEAGEAQLDISDLNHTTIQKLRKYVSKQLKKQGEGNLST